MNRIDYIALTIAVIIVCIGLIRAIFKRPITIKVKPNSSSLSYSSLTPHNFNQPNIIAIESDRHEVRINNRVFDEEVFVWQFAYATRITGIEGLCKSPLDYTQAIVTSIKVGNEEQMVHSAPLHMIARNGQGNMILPGIAPGVTFAVTIQFKGDLTIRPVGFFRI